MGDIEPLRTSFSSYTERNYRGLSAALSSMMLARPVPGIKRHAPRTPDGTSWHDLATFGLGLGSVLQLWQCFIAEIRGRRYTFDFPPPAGIGCPQTEMSEPRRGREHRNARPSC